MGKRTKRKASFKAKDGNGKVHTLHLFVDIVDTSDMDGASEIEGHPSIRTEKGQSVNKVGKGEYEVVPTGQKLFSSDPLAP